MKIAVFGDIHGNIEALKAAYGEALSGNVDKIFHLGDLGGYAPFVNEVVDFIREHGIEGVQGNYDYNVAMNNEHCGCRYEDPVQAGLANGSFEWTKLHASQKSREFMKTLPQTLSFQAHDKNVLLFHATPHKNNLYWHEDRPAEFFLEMAGKARADVMIYGHTHKPYRKDLEGRVFINAGSVGKPKDGDPRACLVIVEITPGSVGTDFLRIEYDVEKVASEIVKSGLPPGLAERLRLGK
ncbi:MAG: metallophosphoesterase family protein [Nitrospiraceae bacterium]|nr:metallophosphoesterase family protein [Nitrospiraceae bacterium]